MRVFAHSLDTICIGYRFVHCSKCILFLFPTTTTTTVVLVHTLLWCGNSLNLSNQRTKKLTRHIPKQKMLKLIIVYCPFEACQMQVQVRQWLKDVKLTQAFCIAYVVFIVFQKVQYWILLSRFLRFTERKLKVFMYCSSLKSTVFFCNITVYTILYMYLFFC